MNWKAHFRTPFSTRYVNYVHIVYKISCYTLFQTRHAQHLIKSKPFSNAYCSECFVLWGWGGGWFMVMVLSHSHFVPGTVTALTAFPLASCSPPYPPWLGECHDWRRGAWDPAGVGAGAGPSFQRGIGAASTQHSKWI